MIECYFSKFGCIEVNMLKFCGIVIVYVSVLPSVVCLLNHGTISGGHQDKLVTELIQNVSRLNQALDAATAREQSNMADFIKANIQLQQSFIKLQETLRLERNQSVDLQQRLNQTIVDQQRRIENLEKEMVDHNRTNTIQQQRIDELEKADINHTETITSQQQTINELEKELADHNMTSIAQQQRIAELGRAEIHHNKTLSEQQRTMNELQNDKLVLNKILISNRQKLDYLESTGININRTFHLYQTEMDSKMNQSFGAYQVILHDIVDKHNQDVTVYNNQSIALNQSVADLGKQLHYLSLSLLDTEKKCIAINASLTGMYIPINKWPLNSCAIGIIVNVRVGRPCFLDF